MAIGVDRSTVIVEVRSTEVNLVRIVMRSGIQDFRVIGYQRTVVPPLPCDFWSDSA